MGALNRRVGEAVGLLLVVCIGVRLAAWVLEPLTVPLLIAVTLLAIAAGMLHGRWR